MGDDDKPDGKAITATPTGGQMVRDLARRSGADLNVAITTPGMMCQQGSDWSRGHSCIPQKFVQLVGHRDRKPLPSATLPQRPIKTARKTVLWDTPIG